MAVSERIFQRRASKVDFYDKRKIKDSVNKLKDVDLTDEGHYINESGYKPIIEYAKL
jgi:hypothetical protein